MTLKPVMRSAAVAAAALTAAAALSACGAGQIAQTAHQVAAVDGASMQNAANTISLRDVTVLVQHDDPMAVLKFTAINTAKTEDAFKLKSITVGGQKAIIPDDVSIKPGCVFVSDTTTELKGMGKAPTQCADHSTVTVKNPGFPPGGNVDVTFDFDKAGTVTFAATVSDTLFPAGKVTLTSVPDADTGHGKDAKAEEAKHTAAENQ